MGSVTVRAPAKINLQLAVGGRRPDGYHELATVFHAVSLYDDVTATEAATLRVTVGGDREIPFDGVPRDDSNLAARAAVALAEHAGLEPEVHLHIHKGIPLAGGMAGGSADAAAALVACDALWGTGLSRAELHALATTLGSDVPFALMGGTAVGLGRGELLTPALARGRFEWVLALSDEGLSTAQVYAECDRLRGRRVLPEPRVSDALMAAVRAGDAHALGPALRNDLQPAACSLRPGLRQILDVGDEYGALGSVVSGSGPTVALLARGTEHALDLAVALGASGACQSVKRASGPATAARAVEGSAARRV
ncbi:MAG: 4-diphosphocytidyl-2-C-methyl-D-erythritol kinase [Actinomycetota bacterium]|jgi:4-diphosphocytidyl-2-C-methyl-D-erythritol kinase|nr:4-diphosphocytidyl-2-C-methyl-D-erythritol kinase [Actinomycetota bacterium]